MGLRGKILSRFASLKPIWVTKGDKQTSVLQHFPASPIRENNPRKSRVICYLRLKKRTRNGARYRVRTCDPYRVKVVLYH
jgi:hypothetical protein